MLAAKAQHDGNQSTAASGQRLSSFFTKARLLFCCWSARFFTWESVKNGLFSHTFSRFLVYEAFGNTFVALCFRFFVKWECYEKDFITSILLVIVRML